MRSIALSRVGAHTMSCNFLKKKIRKKKRCVINRKKILEQAAIKINQLLRAVFLLQIKIIDTRNHARFAPSTKECILVT